MLEYLRGTSDDIGLWDNCASRSWEVLKAGGVLMGGIAAHTPGALGGQVLTSGAQFTRMLVPRASSVPVSATHQFEVNFSP